MSENEDLVARAVLRTDVLAPPAAAGTAGLWRRADTPSSQPVSAEEGGERLGHRARLLELEEMACPGQD